MSQLDALLLTLVIELAVGVTLLRTLGERVTWGRAALAVVAVSLVTHPLAWAANTTWLRALAFAPRAALIELAVVALEAALLCVVVPLRWRRALVVALAMNAASFGIGLLL